MVTHHPFRSDWVDFETTCTLDTAPHGIGGAEVAEAREAVGENADSVR